MVSVERLAVVLWCCAAAVVRMCLRQGPEANRERSRGAVKDSLKTLTLETSLYISLKIRLYIIKSAYLKW
jgi:hypothetical protein